MFFDRKEDVIDLELTQYGKYLLSKGKMRPAYYAFYDDDILYDSEYAGYAEGQNDSEDRIRLHTPRTRTQYVFSGIETEVKRINEMVRSKMTAQRVELGADSIQPVNDKHFALVSPIGTSDLNTDKAPAWYTKVHKGEVTETKYYTHLTGSSSKTKMNRVINYPQIECQAVYRTSIDLEQIDTNALFAGQLTVDDLDMNGPAGFTGPAGGLIKVEEDFLLINVEEKNTQFLLKNFDIELFEIEEKKDVVNNKNVNIGDENLIPLNFVINQGYDGRNKDYLSLDGGKLYEEAQLDIISPPITNKDVEYYFDIYIDEEISSDILCAHIKDRSKGVFTDEFIDCGEGDNRERIVEDLYSVEQAPEESGEIC